MDETENLADLVVDLSRPRAPGVLLGRLTALDVIGRGIARLFRSPLKARWAATRVTRLHARLLQLTQGRMRRSWLFAAGQPVLALTTTGRRSGRLQTTTVTALCYEDKLATVGMNLGLERNPGWAYNLTENPEALITIRGTTIPVRARRTIGDEWGLLWKQWTHVQPSAEAFAELAGRQIPIFVLERRE